MARAGHRPLPGRRERGHVRDRAAAREGSRRGGEADELRHPAHRLVLDLRGRGRPDREVGVEARGEEIAEHADLEPGGGDEGEEAGADLGDRLVERPAGILEHLEHARRRLRQRRLEQRLEPIVDRRLARARVVEAPPCLGDDLGGALERLLARDVEAEAHAGRLGMSASTRPAAVTDAGHDRDRVERRPLERGAVDEREQRAVAGAADRLALEPAVGERAFRVRAPASRRRRSDRRSGRRPSSSPPPPRRAARRQRGRQGRDRRAATSGDPAARAGAAAPGTPSR